MFYHYNDYLVPVIVARSASGFTQAKVILKKKKVKPHIFATGFSFYQRLFFNCHTVKPEKEFWIFQSLISYAEALDEYYTPAIIICDEADRAFFDKYSSELEKYYIRIDYGDYMNDDMLEQEEDIK